MKQTRKQNLSEQQLTDRQAKILDYIRQVTRVRSYPPSVREIGEAVGLSSSSTVHNHLLQLERRGLIRRDPSKSRTVQLVEDVAGDSMINAGILDGDLVIVRPQQDAPDGTIVVALVEDEATVKRLDRSAGR